MKRLVSTVAAGCCCAVLTACGAPAAEVPASDVRPSRMKVALPQPKRAWDEDFAAATTLERLTVDGHILLVPKGIRLPRDTDVTAATEATIVMADARAGRVAEVVARSARLAGYEEFAKQGDVTVWVGHGMAVRLEALPGAQVLAWGPESMKDAFSEFR